jgi:ribosomal protein S18 acetylase RimI-like enzyme
MGLANGLAVVRDRIRRDGWSFTLRRIRDVVRERLIPSWEYLYCIEARNVATFELPTDTRLEVAVHAEDLSEDRWNELARNLGEDTMPLYRQRLKQGIELHMLLVGDRIAGSRFVIWGRVHSFQHVPLTENDVMSMDARINPEFRGRRLASLLYSLSTQNLARRGCERQWFVVSRHNVRSVRTLERIGCRRLLSLRCVWGHYRFDQDIVQ